MARALVVGCGCRGRELGGQLLECGWAVRGTSRTRAGVELIENAGLEGSIADPLHPGTVFDLIADVTVLVWLLGSATGDREDLEAIHGARLGSLVDKLVDTPVRGLVYEAEGSVPADLIDGGVEIVEDAAERWRIPVEVLRLEADAPGSWASSACAAVESLLGR